MISWRLQILEIWTLEGKLVLLLMKPYSAELVILNGLWVTVSNVAIATGISKRSVDITIKDYLNFHKVWSWWVSKQLNYYQKIERMMICQEFLRQNMKAAIFYIASLQPMNHGCITTHKHKDSVDDIVTPRIAVLQEVLQRTFCG